MKILKPGKVVDKVVFRGGCGCCGCEVECEPGEVRHSATGTDLWLKSTVDCPMVGCRGLIPVKELRVPI